MQQQPRGGQERGRSGEAPCSSCQGLPGKDASRAKAQTQEGPDLLYFQQVASVPGVNSAQRFKRGPVAHGNEETGRVSNSE